MKNKMKKTKLAKCKVGKAVVICDRAGIMSNPLGIKKENCSKSA